jgi:hypothetical protein
MAATVSKAGPYYSTGSISFSSLRSNFRAQLRKQASGDSATFNVDNDQISASELLRITTTTDTNPVVPDATENANVSVSSDWKTSQFRGSIKYFYIAQSGTDLNFDIDAQSWNSNLDKNILKFLYIDGTCGSNDFASPAAQLNANSFNLTVDVYGSILGAAGRGGGTGSGAPEISGQNGGLALQMSSGSGDNNIVFVRSGGRIYGGGAGGEKGKTGDNGSGGNCSYVQYFQGGCGCPGCPGGWQDLGCGQNYGNHCSRRQQCGCWGDCWWVSNGDSRYNNCRYTYNVSGGNGGEGGNGGLGRGYNNQTGSLSGSAGAAGAAPAGCTSGGSYYTASPTNGLDGETGGSGGDWGSNGENTNNSGTGGTGARAITGNNYTVQGTINTTTIKGFYNP